MAKRVLTTESGAPVADNQNSASAGLGGPLLLQDQHLLEKLARFNRERIPERVVHARGSGAYGYFEVTDDVTGFTRADFLSEVGSAPRRSSASPPSRTRSAARTRSATRAASPSSSTRTRAITTWSATTPRCSSSRTRSSSPTSSTRRSATRTTAVRSRTTSGTSGALPEATHQVTWLMGDRGIPASYRHMNGYGSHTYQWTNAQGEAFFVKYHFKTNQGVRSLSADQAAELVGKDANSHQTDLLQAIERGVNPSWTLYVQVMPAAEAADYRFNPFDLTKVWPHADHPLQRVGRLVLDRNPDNVFAEVEQAAFSPNNFVPGIGPSPDKMLQGRLFAYADAHRYRLGVNHTQLPVNAPRTPVVDNYGRDGLHATRYGSRYDKNYEPNSYAGPAQTDAALSSPLAVHGWTGTHEAPAHAKDDDFFQAGELYRLMSEDEKGRLVANIAGGLSQVTRDDVIEKNLAHFHAADADYGKRVEEAVRALRED
ncbi:catalase [Streptomyces californicus]